MRSPESPRSRCWPAVLAALLVCVVGFQAVVEPVRPEDLWWHLGMGRVILATRSIPTRDLFSFTEKGSPFFDQPWLAQCVLYGAHRLVGLAGLLDLNLLLMVLAEGLAAAAAVRRGARLSVALAAQIALAPMAWRGWSARPQSFAVALFALTAFLLAREGARPPADRRLAALPLAMVAWVNVHGSFPLGIALVLLALAPSFATARESRPAAAFAAAATCAAAVVNPRGVEVFAYVSRLAASPTVHLAREWRPLSLGDPEGAYVALAILAAALVAWRKRAPLADVALLAPFVLLAAAAVRNGIWLSLLLGPRLACWLSRGPERGEWRPALAGAGAATALFLLVPYWKPWALPEPYGSLAWRARTPVAAAQFLARERRGGDPPRRLFHGIGFGSYLIWALPDQPVFIDPRFELYPMSQFRALFAAEGDAAVDETLRAYGIDGLLLAQRDEAPLVRALRARRDFELRYEDDVAAYFRRAPGAAPPR